MYRKLFFGIVAIVLFFGAGQAHALDIPFAKVRDDGYAAHYLGQSIPDPLRIEAGDTATVVFKFKNIGTKTWDNDSARFISAYTMEPRYRASEFQAENWLDYRQTAKIVGVVEPGEIGELVLQLKAPGKLGHYTEKFWLAADGYSWVKGGYFYVEIDVVEPRAKVDVEKTALEPSPDVETPGGILDYVAKRLVTSKKSVTAKGGERVGLVVSFKNVGSETWESYSIAANEPTGLASASQRLTFADEGWNSQSAVVKGTKIIAPAGVVREKFYFRTPSKAGEYTLRLTLQADDHIFSDEAAEVSVTVTEDAPEHYVAPSFGGNTDKIVVSEKPRLDSEPRIRVGVWRNPETEIQFRSFDDNYVVYDGTVQKGILSKEKLGILNYNDGVYSFDGVDKDGEKIEFTTNNYIRLSPETNPHAVFILLNYKRRVSWKGPTNFNKYRGAMEYRSTQSDEDRYFINDLLFEDYVAGIAETSNISPMEYIKSLLTAARTYAYYVQQYSNKHDARNFDVVAHTGDQLYLGYESEVLMPRVVEASTATRGYMVTYDTDENPETLSDVVITPYFANSDGRTRSWTDVWGGTDKPWLRSIKANYDAGKTMYGHGVGMSARDAAYRAEEEKLDFKELLKYYYTGVGVERIY